MKKLSLAVLAVLTATCGGDTGGDNNNDDDNGGVAVGEECTGTSANDRGDCASGLVCKRESGSFVQRCHEPCDVEAVPDACGNGSYCALDLDGDLGICIVGDTVPEFGIGCTGTGRGSCDAGLTCYGGSAGTICVDECATTGDCGAGRTCSALGNGSVMACFVNANSDGTCDAAELTECPSDGLCLPAIASGSQDFCHAPCDTSAADTCGAGLTCSDVTDLFGLGELCVGEVGRSELCLSRDGGDFAFGDCAASVPQGRCIMPGGYDVLQCKATCPSAQIGTGQGDCATGELCLDSGDIEVQGGFTSPVECDAPTDCDQVNQYECITVNVGGGQLRDLCIRSLGVCGTAGPVLTAADLNDPLNEFDPETEACNVPGTDVYCGGLPGATASVECGSTGILSVQASSAGSNTPLACDPDNDGAECLLDAGFSCLQTTSGNVCGIPWYGCIAFCTDMDNPNAPDLTCGTRTCTAQDPTGDNFVGQLIAQENTSGNPINCAVPTDCDQANGYTCRSDVGVNGQPVCFKPRKICL